MRDGCLCCFRRRVRRDFRSLWSHGTGEQEPDCQTWEKSEEGSLTRSGTEVSLTLCRSCRIRMAALNRHRLQLFPRIRTVSGNFLSRFRRRCPECRSWFMIGIGITRHVSKTEGEAYKVIESICLSRGLLGGKKSLFMGQTRGQ